MINFSNAALFRILDANSIFLEIIHNTASMTEVVTSASCRSFRVLIPGGSNLALFTNDSPLLLSSPQ